MRPVLIACCGLMLALAAAAPAQAQQYVVGETVADFTLNDSNGTPVSLYDYEDRVVVLNFWQNG